MKILLRVLLLFAMTEGVLAESEFVVTHRSPYTPLDKHHDYSNELLALALEKTRQLYGPFTLKAMPPRNYTRSLKAAVDDAYPNLVIETSYERLLDQNSKLTYINFPLDLGVLGYRICFINPKLKASGQDFTNLEQLKKYTFAHGVGWADTAILRHNGLSVREMDNYDGIFLMVLSGRVDFFCRGANEILNERMQFKELTDLEIDDSFMLVYSMPRLFYLNSKNTLAKERLEVGIKMAYEDGSLQQLWLKHFKTSLEWAQLSKRKAIYLENPLLGGLALSINPDFLSLLAPVARASSSKQAE